jgi:hypothetical protein
MDPNLFHVDWERMFEVMVLIVVLSFFVERSLSVLFGSRIFIKHVQGKSLKELIAFAFGALVCWYWDFDAFSVVMTNDNVTVLGALLTGAIIAGGSKASIKLFQDILKLRSTAERMELASIEPKPGKEPQP